MNDFQRTVLFVDDEEHILRSLKRLLKHENYRLLTAKSGAEGLEVLRKNHVQVVISDQRMPAMTGTEFLENVKLDYPNALRIVLTGHADLDSIVESINKGHIYNFFFKPWDNRHLKLEIKQALEYYDLLEANRKLQEEILKKMLA
jgi:DNA-binding NtrC family response regulator